MPPDTPRAGDAATPPAPPPSSPASPPDPSQQPDRPARGHPGDPSHEPHPVDASEESAAGEEDPLASLDLLDDPQAAPATKKPDPA